ncbi:restriction endonuclease subunit S [Methanosarcina mazei]|uniref:Restriction endonuclease subunit S n=2 Tax=Methanosarcina mazei TaxID=2209 RepID=A0A0F8N5F6_METMZ|nr:restriction endonuclease subunit S [Methanosarcina mazei]AAM31895.1 type I restriction-modification system specificity subunit [Methanosarcina mazei Go1]KKH19235.1 restriction endonuclease subunit S [Methanosarcina mazei]KKH19784.1 restriction endonuclease subunit S [Methanosarcina mazei]KKH23545.1 restriction endonuclease subunit S [Methanosarcina mazei]KKH28112.1 restriction endonuclease subunit S [Methanosarcina mazei]
MTGEWKECKLREIASEIKSGGTPSTKHQEYYGGIIPWLNTKEIHFNRIRDTDIKITEGGLNNSSAKWVKENSIIVAMYGATAGKIAINKIPLTTNQACCNITPDSEKADYNFVYYNLCHRYDELVNLSCGAAQQNLNVGLITNLDIILPPITEQCAIASVLSSLDDKIDLLHRQNKTLEAMAETLFRQWFVEEADEDWEEGFLPDEFDFTMGQSPPGTSYNQEGVGKPMFQGNADFGFRFPEERVYTTEPTRLAYPHDTLISVRAPVGAQNMAKVECCIGRGVSAFRYKANNDFYTYTYFKLRSLMDEIKKFNDEGTVFGSISKTDFLQMGIAIPPEDIIEKFEIHAKPLNDKVIENCIQIKLLEVMRDTLLPKLMSGEVRVEG